MRVRVFDVSSTGREKNQTTGQQYFSVGLGLGSVLDLEIVIFVTQ